MLDAHPNIWGMGEDSIFNGRLNSFRTDLVAAASNNREVRKVVNKHGNAIVHVQAGPYDRESCRD
jgi:hypothetical protein